MHAGGAKGHLPDFIQNMTSDEQCQIIYYQKTCEDFLICCKVFF